MQQVKNSQDNLEKKNKKGGITLPDIKMKMNDKVVKIDTAMPDLMTKKKKIKKKRNRQ